MVGDLGTFIMEWLDSHSLLDYHHVIIPTAYVLINVFACFILHRIHFALPLIMHLSIVIVTSYDEEGWSFKDGYLHVALASMIFWNWCRKTNEIDALKLKDPDLAMYYAAIAAPSKKSEAKITSLHISILLLIILGVLLTVSSSYGVDRNLVAILPVVVLMLACTHIPGVGGHSTTAIAATVFLGLIALLTVPQLLDLLIQVLTSHFAPPASDLRGVNIPGQVMKVMSYPSESPITAAVSGTDLFSVFRGTIGSALLMYIALDDFWGPSYLIRGALESRAKDKTAVPMKGLAGFFSSPWIINLVVSTSWTFLAQDPLMFAMMAIGSAIGFFYHKYVASQTWIARGQSLTLTGLRDGMSAAFGTGASGFRKLTFFAAGIVAVFLWINTIGGKGVVAAMITLAALRADEKTTTIFTGVVTCNIGLIITGILSKYPLTGTIEQNSVNAYSPVAGGNSNTGANDDSDSDTDPQNSFIPVPPSVIQKLRQSSRI